MKVKEICNMLDDGMGVQVQFKERINDFESRYEQDMRTYLTGYTIDGENIDESQCVIFSTNEKDYADFNKSMEKPIWLDNKSKTYCLTWSEEWAGESPNVDVYENNLDSEIETFEVLNNESLALFNLYKQSNVDVRYTTWLEEQIVKYTNFLSKV